MTYKYEYDNAKQISKSENDTISTVHIQNMVRFSTEIEIDLIEEKKYLRGMINLVIIHQY